MRAMRGWLIRIAIVGAAVVAVGAAVAAATAVLSDDAPQLAPPRTAVLLAAGDIGDCEQPGDEATAQLLARYPNATIAALGDLAYQHGSPEDFERCYEPTWGRFKDRTRPAPGNHDYSTKGAAGYFGYFGTAAGNPDEGWYSYDLGPWHIVSLNSECRRVGGCARDEPQIVWLENDLRQNTEVCQLAYFHRPPYTSGRYRDDYNDLPRMRLLWRVLVEHGVDIVLVGHEHSYERFVPMDELGNADSHGTYLFVVGTGGGNLREYREPPLPTTAVRNADTWGVLKLTLHEDRFDWEFLRARGGNFTDSGSGRCR